MSIEQHTSVANALSLAPEGFFLGIGDYEKQSELSLKTLPQIRERMELYLGEAELHLDKARSGWKKETRKVPPDIRETIGAHMVKVAIECNSFPMGLLIWSINHGLEPSQELLDLIFNLRSRFRLVRKGFFHDFVEWGDNPDLMPGEKTQEEKERVEYNAVCQYAEVYGDDFPLLMHRSLQEKSLENDIIFNDDKINAAVMALNYKRLGCNVDDFFPYAFSKFTLPMMGEILQFLIDHKDDYPDIDFFIQYNSLLYNGGMTDLWKREMDMRSQYGDRWHYMATMERIRKSLGKK